MIDQIIGIATCDGYRVQYMATGMTLDGAFILEVSLYVLRSHQAMAQNFFTSYYNVSNGSHGSSY